MKSQVEIIPINRGEFTKEIILLCQEENFSSYSALKNILSYQWDKCIRTTDDNSIGYIMRDGINICGFIGCIRSKRIIDGRYCLFCNLSNGIVKPAYRRYSLQLFSVAISGSDVVLDLTPSPAVCKFLKTKYFGFNILEENVLCFNSKLLNNYDYDTVRIDEVCKILKLTKDNEECINILDNAKYYGRFVLFEIQKKQLIVSFYVSYIRKIKTVEIIYVSDKKIFSDNYSNIIMQLCLLSHTIFCYCDPRYFLGEPYGQTIELNKKNLLLSYINLLRHTVVKIPRPSLFKINDPSISIDKSSIDGLYTERILIDYMNIDKKY